MIGGKWKSCIIQELCTGPKRPSELHRLFTEASPRVINQQLKELEMCIRDSPEFISCAEKLQVGHPPGAPFYMHLRNGNNHKYEHAFQVGLMGIDLRCV